MVALHAHAWHVFTTFGPRMDVAEEIGGNATIVLKCFANWNTAKGL